MAKPLFTKEEQRKLDEEYVLDSEILDYIARMSKKYGRNQPEALAEKLAATFRYEERSKIIEQAMLRNCPTVGQEGNQQ